MDTNRLAAEPRLLKQANLSLMRRIMKTRDTVTRAELAEETQISPTTVRLLMREMLQDGELESVGYDPSSGGRKAERYRFRADRYCGAAVCMIGNEAYGLLTDACGSVLESRQLETEDVTLRAAVFSYLDAQTHNKEIRVIGLGVPGIVEGGGYWQDSDFGDEMHKYELGDLIAERYGVPVVLENDVNAIILGFGRCYHHQYPLEGEENTNMAYLHLEKGCVSAGFIAGGKIIRGCGNFAGELGLLPMEDGRTLSEQVGDARKEQEYIRIVTQIAVWICGILNPRYIALGGPGLRKECVGEVGVGLSALLPKPMAADILYVPDVWRDYCEGMALLTAEKMFDEVRLVQG